MSKRAVPITRRHSPGTRDERNALSARANSAVARRASASLQRKPRATKSATTPGSAVRASAGLTNTCART
jgi:hypothetical protein